MSNQLKRLYGKEERLPETYFPDLVASGDSLSGFPQASPEQYIP